MQLVTKLVAVGTGAFVTTGALLGITIPLVNRNKNSVTDCSTVECETNFECINEDNKSPTCNCISGFVTIMSETDEGSEKVCHKTCETSSECRPDEVCKEDNELGGFCIACADLDTCDGVNCEDPEGCEVVNSHPQCKCPSNELLIEKTTSGIHKRRCLKICEQSSQCNPHQVCKEDPTYLIFCVASVNLDACDDTIRCEAPEACELVNHHPKCKCPLNELLIETEISGTPERRCRKSCSTTDNCEPGSLCFEDSILKELYCEDRRRIRQCSDAVECTPETECRQTIDMKTECLCTNELESTHIESTESGSRRTCNASSCEDSDECPRTQLCLIDKYSKQGCCQVRGDECPAEVECPALTICKPNTDGLAECLCSDGYTEIAANGLTATTRTCHTQTCRDSNGCGKRDLCYHDKTSKQFYCTDGTKGCEDVVCPDKTECFDTNKGYSACMCSKGYTTTTETVTDDVRTTTRSCDERICRTSDNCKGEYLCYLDVTGDSSGFCTTRLKGCDGVECPSTEFMCRNTPSGFAECLCNEGKKTAVYESTMGVTRICLTQTCTDSNNCGLYNLCYHDEISEDFYCADGSKGCEDAVCPDNTECFANFEGYSDCKCTKGYTTLSRSSQSRVSTTMRTCGEETCSTSNDCKVEYLCYLDSADDEFGFCSTRLKGCDGLKCPLPTVGCKDAPSEFAECKCENGKYIAVDPTVTGGTIRSCHACTSSDHCFPGSICYPDDLLMENTCTDDRTPDEQNDKCSKVLCSGPTECLNSRAFADCFCLKNALTLIKRTDSGSQRICGNVGCINQLQCLPLGIDTVCYRDPSSLDQQCIAPHEVDSCDNVLCSNNTFCKVEDYWRCGCSVGERFNSGFCDKPCDSQEVCSTESLGDCTSSGVCSDRPVRPS